MLFLCGHITNTTTHPKCELMQWRERSGVSLEWFHLSVRVLRTPGASCKQGYLKNSLQASPNILVCKLLLKNTCKQV
ncbi:hypothetical protein Y032_0373g179 [Ancylostoma ceylanicum]|uniref:Uncharacterized protein n=1 Tax=Ancylostoma ceylanicum TaxID=53326 RepID=A0A016RU03_9BILA|nr:hypothetical protein Y032_0373g179 [Ancylostoma ceylanicum]